MKADTVGLDPGDPNDWERVRQMFNMLSHLGRLGAAGEPVRVRTSSGITRGCRGTIVNAAGSSPEDFIIKLFLTHGLRLLSAPLFITPLTLDKDLLKRPRVVIHEEDFPGSLEFMPLHIVELARVDKYTLKMLKKLRKSLPALCSAKP